MEIPQAVGMSSQLKVNEPSLRLLRPGHSFRKKGGLNLLFERRVYILITSNLSRVHLVTSLERGKDLTSSYSKEQGETQTQTQQLPNRK